MCLRYMELLIRKKGIFPKINARSFFRNRSSHQYYNKQEEHVFDTASEKLKKMC